MNDQDHLGICRFRELLLDKCIGLANVVGVVGEVTLDKTLYQIEDNAVAANTVRPGSGKLLLAEGDSGKSIRWIVNCNNLSSK